MEDHIFFDDFEVLCKVGTTPEERAFPQVASVGIKAYIPLKAAGQSDDLTKSVDYAHIRDEVIKLAGTGEFNLVEKVAEDIAKLILSYTPIQATEIRISKKVFPEIRGVGVHIYRAKK